MTLVGALAVGVVLGVMAAGGGDTPESGATTTARATRTSVPPQARELALQVARLSTEQKVAKVFLWGLDTRRADPATLRRLRSRELGGVAVAGSDPGRLKRITRALGSGPLVLAAQEGGAFNAVRGLPPQTAPSDLADAAAGAGEADKGATRLRGAGIDGVLAPGLDIGAPDNPAVGERAFSEEPAEAARFARGVVSAYRSRDVFTAPGSFPGLGSASQPVEQGPANVSLSPRELEARDLRPFRAAIRAGAPGIQISNGLYAYDDFVTPGSLSRAVMVGLLRRKLGFRGVAITGDLTDAGVTALAEPSRAAVDALKAGADLLYLSGPAADQHAAYDAVLAAVRRKAVSRQRLDEAVTHVLEARRDYGA